MPRSLIELYNESPYQDAHGATEADAIFAFALPVEEASFGFRVFVSRGCVYSIFGQFLNEETAMPISWSSDMYLTGTGDVDAMWESDLAKAAMPKLQVAWAELMTQLNDCDLPPFNTTFSYDFRVPFLPLCNFWEPEI
jgi:hypothetical protein